MGLAPNIDELAKKVGERRRASPDKSTEKFYQIIRDVILAADIRNKSQQARYFRNVHAACVRHSANARSSRTAHQRPAQRRVS